MRVLLATDGSPPAHVAVDLAGSIAWPAESVIRLVTVTEPVDIVFGAPWATRFAPQMAQMEADLAAHGRDVLEEAARRLVGTGCTVERKVLHGRPGSCIVEEARQFGAELVVLGSRGHGTILSMLLGSVAGEVADHADSPVLVARGPVISRAVLAHDGSDHAGTAEQLIASWPIFADVAIEVASVAQTAGTRFVASSAELYAATLEEELQATHELIRQHAQLAEAAAKRLSQAGRRASDVSLEGDPAAGILRVAEQRQADLIVLGTHGRTGIRRLLLGSVARNVMLHAPISVLVVREPRTTD